MYDVSVALQQSVNRPKDKLITSGLHIFDGPKLWSSDKILILVDKLLPHTMLCKEFEYLFLCHSKSDVNKGITKWNISLQSYISNDLEFLPMTLGNIRIYPFFMGDKFDIKIP